MVYNQLLMQFQSDILGVPVVRPQVAETTALGAAYAAGLAVGFWDDLEDLRQNWLIDETWDPEMDYYDEDLDNDFNKKGIQAGKKLARRIEVLNPTK